MLEYSAFFHHTERLITLAKEADIGVIVMRPLGGSGRTSSIRARISEGDTSLTPGLLLRYVLSKTNKAVAVLSLQSKHLRDLKEKGLVWEFSFLELESVLAELFNLQGKSERIKNFLQIIASKNDKHIISERKEET